MNPSDHSVSARIGRHLDALGQDPDFQRAREMLHQAAQRDASAPGDPRGQHLSYEEYLSIRPRLPGSVQARLSQVEQELRRDYERAQRVPGGGFVIRQLMGSEIRETNSELSEAGLPRIDAPFVRAMIGQWQR